MYDESGRPIAFALSENNGAYEYYFYESNIFGDVTAIYDAEGNVVARYKYDAWGNFEAVTSKNYFFTDASLFKYRGYIYDWDTGFYYLQSRYYDPVVGRFLNSDNVGYLGAGGDFASYNLFAYCYNNPINYMDPSGDIPVLIILVVVGVVAIGTPIVKEVASMVNYKKNTQNQTGILSSGFINNQKNMSNLKFGLQTSDENGCGWIAVYNAMLLLGDPQQPADVIRSLDNATLLFGFLGVSPTAISGYFDYHGYKVKFSSVFSSKVDRINRSKKATAGILMYKHSQGLHYIAFKWNGSEYEIYNGRKTTVKSLESHLRSENLTFLGMWTIS